MFASFGCSLDALDAPDKLAMKLAYMDAVREGRVEPGIARDPYDLLSTALVDVPGLVTAGRLEIESWLTPRPRLDDLEKVDVLLYREFIDTGGCVVMAARLREFVRQMVLPLKPLLIGVDHSLTGGVLDAICGADPDRMGVIVLDSHLDAIQASVRRDASGKPEPTGGKEDDGPGPPPDSYNCGTWLAGIIERTIISPGNIAVLGPADAPRGTDEDESRGVAAFRQTYERLLDSGVRVISRRRIREAGVEAAAAEAMDGMKADQYYVSIDADIGAGEHVKAVRFLDAIGLEPEEVTGLCGALGRAIKASGGTLAGMDVMEVDVHLADIPGSRDRTIEMCAGAVREMIQAVAG